MDIYAKEDTKVIFKGNVTEEQIKWGGHADPTEFLIEGKEYTVDYTKIHSWHTKVFLKEFPHLSFNSVWFETVEHDPEKCGCKYLGNDTWSCGHIDNNQF